MNHAPRRASPIWRWASIGLLLFGCWAMGQPATSAERSTRTPKTSATKAEDTGKLDPQVEAKLNEILAHQEQILQRLDQVMEELRIVKIRATVR